MPGFKTREPKPSRTYLAGKAKTAADWDCFLEHFAKTCNQAKSCELANINVNTVYEKRKADPEFEIRYQEAKARGWDVMEEIARKRAYTGYKEPVFYKGKKVAEVEKVSEPLMMFLLKGNKPETFRDRVETTLTNVSAGPSRLHKLTEEELEAELQRRLG